jgi:hypothetical protein
MDVREAAVQSVTQDRQESLGRRKDSRGETKAGTMTAASLSRLVDSGAIVTFVVRDLQASIAYYVDRLTAARTRGALCDGTISAAT